MTPYETAMMGTFPMKHRITSHLMQNWVKRFQAVKNVLYAASVVLTTISHELAIPMYLDTTVLLDILASIEDDFTMSNNVTTVSSSSKSSELSGKRRISHSAFCRLALVVWERVKREVNHQKREHRKENTHMGHFYTS